MTFGEILAQVVSEITGQPKDKIVEIVKSIEKAFPGRQRLEEEIADDMVEPLLNELRKEKAEIIAQFMEYAMQREHHREGNA